jgi:probable rRNA maturation factor
MSPSGSTLLFGAFPKPLRFSRHEKLALKNFARVLADRVGGGRSFTCLITNDGELQRLNSMFLRRNYPADVLSFPAAERNGELGDIAISAERAAAQALAFGHDRIAEISVLMLHGLLHLIGMDHETDQGEMARTEEKWRTEFGLPAGLAARALSGEQEAMTARMGQ